MSSNQLDRLREVVLSHGRAPVGAAEGIVGLVALLMFLLVLSAYSNVPWLPVFGHDEVHYYPDFRFKLSEDGRWLNLLLHDFLRSIPAGAWAVLFLGLSWLLFYRIARSFSFEAAYAAVVASAILLFDTFAGQVLWPATATPGVVLLLLAERMARRGVAPPVIYLLFGALLFGTLQTYYFLLPLLFVGAFLGEAGTGAAPWRRLFFHLCWWVAGSVLGVLLMSLILLVMTGHFGPQPAAWRLTNPVSDLASLGANIAYVGDSFTDHAARFARLSGAPYAIALAFGVAVVLRARALFERRHAMLLLAAVLFSFFVFSIPLAPQIHQRSLASMVAATVLFMAFVPGPSAAGRVFGALLLLVMGHGFSVRDEALLGLHESETAYFREKLQQLIPGHPMTYSAIALRGSIGSARPEARTFDDPSLIHAIVLSLRAPLYLDCRVEARCEGVGEGVPVSQIPFAGGYLRFSVDAGNVGIVEYVDRAGR